MAIDSYKYVDFATRRIMKAWAARQEPGVIPFTPLGKPLRECTVALLSTAGIARHDDHPFDQEGERRNPWWGDPSYRRIPLGTTEKDIHIDHLHIDPKFGEEDLDVLLPMRAARRAGERGNRRAARADALLDHGIHPRAHGADREDGAGHRVGHARRARGRRRARSGLTVLLPVRRTGAADSRVERTRDGDAVVDAGPHAAGRSPAARRDQLSPEPAARPPARRRGQRAVLRATLALLEAATGPDFYVELPFEWPEPVAQARNASREVPPSPIAALLLKSPWLIPKLYSGRIPD